MNEQTTKEIGDKYNRNNINAIGVWERQEENPHKESIVKDMVAEIHSQCWRVHKDWEIIIKINNVNVISDFYKRRVVSMKARLVDAGKNRAKVDIL